MGVRLRPYLAKLRMMLYTDHRLLCNSWQPSANSQLLTPPWLLSLLASAFGPYQTSNILGACRREDYEVERKGTVRSIYEEWCLYKIVFFPLRKVGKAQGIVARWFASFTEGSQPISRKSSDNSSPTISVSALVPMHLKESCWISAYSHQMNWQK